MTGPAGAETTATIQATIDGQVVRVPAGTTILTAARDLGIDIPTLCHHETLSLAASCRICVVEVEGRPNLLPACATELTDGMVLQTESADVVAARRLILDLLLSDHPLACITCEQAGACTLQEYCYRYGIEQSTFVGEKRDLPIESDNPMIERDMNKCILCGKCVRVCQEVQVTDAIDFTERGFESQIAGSFDHALDTSFCRFCGQCVDVCPTGAIANKQLKGVRTWDRSKVRTTCPFCGVGCNFDLNIAGGKVIGVTAAYDAPVNQGSLCVKGRFHTDLITSPDRITTPLIKRGGVFEEATWDEALSLVAARLREIRDEQGNLSVGVLSSARCTNEENYLLQRLTRAGLNVNSIDHCART
jgi:formate dehydrogenase alpha subunit